MNLDPQDAFFSQDVYQVAHDQGYRTALCGKNHTYKTAQGVDFWREYGHNKGYKAPGASADVAKLETWMDELAFHVALEPAPLPVETPLPYPIVSAAHGFMPTTPETPFFIHSPHP